jgi:protein-tyrosine phosphatase
VLPGCSSATRTFDYMTSVPVSTSPRLIRSSGYYVSRRFDALVNFRDLGGHETETGRFTRRGVFYRADGVHRCSASDTALLEGLGVSRVVDLRTAHERVSDGSVDPRHPSIEYRHVPLLDDVSGLGEIAHDEPLVVSYLQMLEERSGRVVAAVNAVVGAPGPVVFHCTAGKDRTGVLAAVLLRAVGVPTEAVVADYAKSHAAMDRLIAWYRTNRPSTDAPVQAVEPGDDRRRRLMGAEPQWMAKVLDVLERRHDGAERYLLSAGATPSTLRELRRRLVQ